jgi:T-complex protein 1 subunit delta
VELSRAQDVEAGDGTTSVVVIAGALLEAAERLLQKDIHPTLISDAFHKASAAAVDILSNMADTIFINDESSLIKVAATSLNSKVT